MFVGSQKSECQIVLDTLKVSQRAKDAPLLVSRSPEKLAKYLTKNDSSAIDKVLSIYTWVTHHIKYDLKSFLKVKSKRKYSVKKTLRKRKGLSYQYSKLFNVLCEHAGIRALDIVGYSRGQYFDEGDTFYEVDHSWNAVKIDNQ